MEGKSKRKGKKG
jgi:hypothetical protein